MDCWDNIIIFDEVENIWGLVFAIKPIFDINKSFNYWTSFKETFFPLSITLLFYLRICWFIYSF